MQKNLDYLKNTQFIFIASKLLNSPLGAMYNLLSFIICKQLGATPFQITLLISSKPLVALISFYSSVFIKNRPERLKSLIISSTILSFIPCFAFPFVTNCWFFIFAFALFMMSAKAMLPAWAEIFKRNIGPEGRSAIFSKGSTVNYLANIFVPLLLAPILDYYPLIWTEIFFILALIQLAHVVFLLRLKVRLEEHESSSFAPNSFSFRSVIFDPWKNSWQLMKQRPDFRNYQIVFLLGGTGLILSQPVLPLFFEQILHLSYTQLIFAVSLCKGIGFAITSPLWANAFNRISINLFNFFVTALAGLFAIVLATIQQEVLWLYLAYLIYGIMQAGSEMSWHLAGPRFAKQEDSTLYTSVNIAMIGLRGCIAPFIGELLFCTTNFSVVFFCSAGCCLAGAFYSYWLEFQDRKADNLTFSAVE
ncbi:MFS transporter [Candidatus Protochlamydia amoebophila]|nr:MFS transporter [Candidatus Protochlamydia amoebophila]